MIPHAAPIRFPELEPGVYLVNRDNPMVRDGVLTGLAAVELAAQAAGAGLTGAARGGVLVTLEAVEVLGTVPAGARVRVDVEPGPTVGALHSARVLVHGLVSLTLCLYLDPA